jgi:CDP-diacylglycerol--glycerol-3-phosphate 3-phosphatidyltransferase
MSAGVFSNWPNRITAARFVGALVLFALLADFGNETPQPGGLAVRAVFWLFIATALTDVLDGYLARKLGQVSVFGRIADPFVDKVLVLGTFVFLAALDWSARFVPDWLVVAVLAREFLVTGIRGYVESQGRDFPADALGKAKMGFQCFAIGFVLGIHAFDWPPGVLRAWTLIAHVLVWGTLLSSIGSGVGYAFKLRRLLGESTA